MPETDAVLTTGEVQRLLDERGVALRALPGAPLDRLSDAAPDDSGRIYGYPGSAGAPTSPHTQQVWGFLCMLNGRLITAPEGVLCIDVCVCASPCSVGVGQPAL